MNQLESGLALGCGAQGDAVTASLIPEASTDTTIDTD